MEIRELRYFVAVVETGSFTAAAKALHMTQPALSWNIKQLEEKLETQLIERTQSGVVVTESGQVFYDGAKDVVAQINRLDRLMKSEALRIKRKIKFGLTILSSINYMEQFQGFVGKYPGVELNFVQRGSKEIQEMMIQDKVDVALISEPIYYPKLASNAKRLEGYYYDVGIVLPKNHRLANRQSVTFDDIKEESIALVSDAYAIGQEVPKRCKALGFTPNITYQNDNWEVVLEHVAAYDSISILPIDLAKIFKRDDLKWIGLDDDVIGRFHLQLVTNLDNSNIDEFNIFQNLYHELNC
ncbi:LysR family transcriptional regulator [Erysipelothrix urinaevulpis]|uniref:LysR family transcriptional regulator n=1 Tax=Erysipelothrix urinaevulpis TaxID=2683717 RepID=UPI00135BADD0|nr:LysR family transcriptional regulator [Erysipelothrix urinaevulpis]